MIFAAALKGSCREREGEGDAAYVNASIHQWLNLRHPPGDPSLLCLPAILQPTAHAQQQAGNRPLDRAISRAVPTKRPG